MEILRILVVTLDNLEVLDKGSEVCNLLLDFRNFRDLLVTIRREIELL